MTDIVYLAWNRLAFTQFSFEKLVQNTDWKSVNRLFVYDDGSSDGTTHWLSEQVVELNSAGKVRVDMFHTKLSSPVAIMNHYLENSDEDRFAKIDNDIVVPPGWLAEMDRMMYLNPALDILGMQADHGPPTGGHDSERHIEEARWIGGVGMIRRRIFDLCRPSPRGRFGWTEYQQNHEQLTKAWIKPDLKTFELDRLPLEPWMSLVAEYLDLGWQRSWPRYPSDATAYWDWAL